MEPKGWTGPRGTELASARAGTALPLSAAPAAPVELLVVVAVAQAAQAAAVFLGLLVLRATPWHGQLICPGWVWPQHWGLATRSNSSALEISTASADALSGTAPNMAAAADPQGTSLGVCHAAQPHTEVGACRVVAFGWRAAVCQCVLPLQVVASALGMGTVAGRVGISPWTSS